MEAFIQLLLIIFLLSFYFYLLSTIPSSELGGLFDDEL
jgi:hypothetical protein